MKGRELERILEIADQAAELQSRLHRITVLEQEIAHEREVARLAPEVARAALDRLPHLEEVARALEEEWVAQGPLVAQWQRAVELAELAEGVGADSTWYRAEVDEARRRVEAARLRTRDFLDALVAEREALMDIALAAPFDLPAAEAVRDDLRPEAARREALALADFAKQIAARAQEASEEASKRLEELARELSEVGARDAVESRLEDLQAQLPSRVELTGPVPPSAVRRLERAGVTVDSPTAV
jgi:hypothetical protein